MRKKIFYSIWIMTLSILTVSIVFIIFFLYEHFTQEQFDQLKNEMDLATEGVLLNGEKYLKNLGKIDFRITWITDNGTILFDNEAELSEMENHLERKEIQDALKTGSGESSRYSDTLYMRQLYYARLLSGGTVLRLSTTQATIWNLFLKFLGPIIAVIAIAMVLSFILASRLSRRIVNPINMLDLDDPLKNMDNNSYVEIRPLLTRLDIQQKQIKKDKDEIEKNSLIRQEFTANASHELKTPLHVISGYAELIETGIVKEEDISKFAKKIRMESQRMTKLVEDIIDLSSLDSGAQGMVWEETDLQLVAQNVIISLQTTAQDAQVDLSCQGEKTVVYGIPDVLFSMVYNLCINAIKYTDPGGKVQIKTKNCDSVAVLTVTDNGIGIPEEDLTRIFERFYRVDKSHSKEVGGTGLGLSIVKHAALIHNAEISVHSKVGEGSEFKVSFSKERKTS